MSTDQDGVFARSRAAPAFSNASEGEAWAANWCARCLRDAPFRRMGSGTGCPILAVTLAGYTPAEFLDGLRDEHGRYSLEHQYHCIEYRPPGGGGGEPQPKPEPPGMDGLFPRPERRARMYVQPAEHAEVPA